MKADSNCMFQFVLKMTPYKNINFTQKVRLIEYSQFNSNVVWHNENTINISADTDKAGGLMPYI